MTIRETIEADYDVIDAIVGAAFGGDGEARLVRALRERDALLELTALENEEAVGHIMFSRDWIDTDTTRSSAVQLAPVSVSPSAQARGIGGALIREGLTHFRKRGESHVFVLGHVDYYPRFGFSAEAAKPFDAPWKGPAHMLARLSASGPEHGKLIAPQAFFA